MLECASIELLSSAWELNGILVESIGVENGEFLVGKLLLTPTGNKGWGKGAEGEGMGSPGGVICNDGWRAEDIVDGRGGLTGCIGNKGCCVIPNGAGGIEIAGCWEYQGWGRAGTGQPAGGTANAGL